jgi:hypothetical protein
MNRVKSAFKKMFGHESIRPEDKVDPYRELDKGERKAERSGRLKRKRTHVASGWASKGRNVGKGLLMRLSNLKTVSKKPGWWRRLNRVRMADLRHQAKRRAQRHPGERISVKL